MLRSMYNFIHQLLCPHTILLFWLLWLPNPHQESSIYLELCIHPHNLMFLSQTMLYLFGYFGDQTQIKRVRYILNSVSPAQLNVPIPYYVVSFWLLWWPNPNQESSIYLELRITRATQCSYPRLCCIFFGYFGYQTQTGEMGLAQLCFR